MPNLINQMRNGLNPSPSWNNVQQVKQLMSNLRASANPQQLLLNTINSNPQLAMMIKGANGNLKGVAEQMARAQGVDLNVLLQQLSM